MLHNAKRQQRKTNSRSEKAWLHCAFVCVRPAVVPFSVVPGAGIARVVVLNQPLTVRLATQIEVFIHWSLDL